MTNTTSDLWRGIHKDEMSPFETEDGPKKDVLLPTMSRKDIGGGRFREADVEIKDDFVQTGGGTSLFDKSPFFKSKAWGYFYIPKDTEIPPELVVTGPVFNKRFDANHYQIEAAKPIRLDAFKGALDNFARSAYAKRHVDAKLGKTAERSDS